MYNVENYRPCDFSPKSDRLVQLWPVWFCLWLNLCCSEGLKMTPCVLVTVGLSLVGTCSQQLPMVLLLQFFILIYGGGGCFCFCFSESMLTLSSQFLVFVFSVFLAQRIFIFRQSHLLILSFMSFGCLAYKRFLYFLLQYFCFSGGFFQA